jgi:hypothetical protein
MPLTYVWTEWSVGTKFRGIEINACRLARYGAGKVTKHRHVKTSTEEGLNGSNTLPNRTFLPCFWSNLREAGER